MRAAIYARVSTQHQDADMQLDELRAYVQARGDTAIEYVDRISGAKESRPALDAMLKDARARKIDLVVCWKLDRLARSLRHLVNLLAEFDSLGCKFVALRDNLDLSTPAGRLQMQIIGAMAEFERSLITERVRAGVKRAKDRGQQLGRPRRIFSLDRAKELLTTMSLREAAAELGVSRETLRRKMITTKSSGQTQGQTQDVA